MLNVTLLHYSVKYVNDDKLIIVQQDNCNTVPGTQQCGTAYSGTASSETLKSSTF